MSSIDSLFRPIRCISPHLLTILVAFPLPASAELANTASWDYLESSIQGASSNALLWQWSWTGVFSANLALNLYQSSEASSPEDRYDARVNSVNGILGLVDLISNPLPHPEVEAEIHSLRNKAESGILHERQALQEAETLFLYTAHDEIDRRNWAARIGALVTNAIAGLVIGIGDHRPRDGLKTFLTGTLTKEVQIRTQPTAISQAWDRYTPIGISVDGHRLQYQYAFYFSLQSATLDIRF